MDKKKRLEIFLREGFFAAQVPPCFSSQDFSKKVQKASVKWDLIKKERCTEEAAFERYSVARVGHNRRPIAIPNAVSQFYLSRCIADEWTSINKFFRRSKLSLSKPSISVRPGRAIEITPIKQLQEARLLRSCGARFALTSDISQFFPSIYTHSIAWALEGKEVAKRKSVRNDKSLLGNRLDELCRYTQQNQTIGIPIGPDTSHVISEIIGVAIDEILRAKLGKWPSGYRHVDDFTLFFDTETEASKALAVLFEALSTYELKPNIQKTKITRVSQSSIESWVHNFDTFEFSQNRVSQRRDLHRFFDMAFVLAERFDDENVLQYALRRVETEIIKTNNWDVFSAYLMRCMDAFPNTIPECVTIVETYHRYIPKSDFDKKPWQIFVSAQLIYHAPFEKHSEVAWLLWLALRLELSVNSNSVKVLEQMKSSICLCICLALESKKLLKKTLAKSKLPDVSSASSLYGPYWLLVYESAVQNWLPTSRPAVQNDRYFRELFKLDVKFFDANQVPVPIFTLKEELEEKEKSSRIVELLDSDESVYDYFEFSDFNRDYLGRRYRREDEDEDEDEDDEDEDEDDDSGAEWRQYTIDDDDEAPW